MIRLFYIIRIKIKAGLRYRELNDFYIYILLQLECIHGEHLRQY